MSDSLVTIALADLRSGICACFRKKQQGMSFCRDCYFLLPDETKKKLYQRVGSGYETSYSEAKKWLRANTNRFLNVPKED